MFTRHFSSRKARPDSSLLPAYFSGRRAAVLRLGLWLAVAGALACLPLVFEWPFGSFAARGLTDTPAQLNGFVQKALLTSSFGASNDHLGTAVALSGDTVLAGAPGDNTTKTDQGSAYVFRRTGAAWTQEAQLLAPDGETGDSLGQSVALEGDVAVAGSPVNNVSAGYNGSVYVFRRTGTSWAFEQKLVPADSQPNDRFGNAIAISGDTIIVGALKKTIGLNTTQGAAYVFRRTGGSWTQETSLTAADGVANDAFGTAVALSGNTAIVGAAGKNSKRGAAYVFTRNGSAWSLEQQLSNGALDANDGFGGALGLSGETAIIGAPQGLVSDQGTAFVFTRAGTVWSEQAQLSASDGENSDGFGASIALTGDTALIGSPYDDLNANPDQGAAYIFVRAGVNWMQQEKLTVNIGAANDQAGLAVALNPQSAVLGIWLKDINQNIDQGAAYVFDVTCPNLSISPGTLPTGAPNVAYNQMLTASGGATPYSFTLGSGALPSGLTLDSSGLLSGTTAESGNFSFSVKVTDNNGCFSTRAYTLASGACPAISLTPLVLTPAPIGTLYIRPVVGSGGVAPYSHSKISGTLPPGMLYSGGGVLNGTPTAFGSYSFTLRATDSNGCSGTHTYTLLVTCQAVTLAPETLPPGQIGQFYTQTLTASGATPQSFSHSGGVLPDGLTLSAEGVLSGNPTTVGSFTFTIKATTAENCAGLRQYTVIINGNGLQYYALPHPIRLFDTRAPIPGATACAYLNQPLLADQESAYQARLTCGDVTIPASAQAIVGNATVVTPAGSGYITLWPNGQARPTVSNLNYLPGQIVPNSFTVRLGSDGRFKVYSVATTDFIVDVTGYFAPPGTGGLYYHALAHPLRLFDTRAPIIGATACAYLDQPLFANSELVRQARTTCEQLTIPADALAIAGNATVVGPAGSGYITLWPNGQARPTVSNLNYLTGQIVPNAFTVGLGSDGQFRIYSVANTHFIVDVTGYYSAAAVDENGAGLLYTPLTQPIRLFDTRAQLPGATACEYLNQPLAANSELAKQARISCGAVTIPTTAQAIAGNATVVSPAAGGYITLWPNGQARPTVSNLNYLTGQIVPNAFTVGLGADGQFRIYTVAATHFIVDVAGFYAP